ncbi:hypothetical protein GJ496_004643 [Pomphorhynchus laevis]|nr:hypothetical protein GJ496_003188 [Pomphorhynchus laevis]KAI0988141.1 hypothetical protein GJ496_004643 [Pomphorhynchus laevis]
MNPSRIGCINAATVGRPKAPTFYGRKRASYLDIAIINSKCFRYGLEYIKNVDPMVHNCGHHAVFWSNKPNNVYKQRLALKLVNNYIFNKALLNFLRSQKSAIDTKSISDFIWSESKTFYKFLPILPKHSRKMLALKRSLWKAKCSNSLSEADAILMKIFKLKDLIRATV